MLVTYKEIVILKYEEKLHFDKYYYELKSNNFPHKVINSAWSIIGYALLFYFVKYILAFIPDFRPWSNFKIWFTLGGGKIYKIWFGLFCLRHYSYLLRYDKTLENNGSKSQREKWKRQRSKRIIGKWILRESTASHVWDIYHIAGRLYAFSSFLCGDNHCADCFNLSVWKCGHWGKEAADTDFRGRI